MQIELCESCGQVKEVSVICQPMDNGKAIMSPFYICTTCIPPLDKAEAAYDKAMDVIR